MRRNAYSLMPVNYVMDMKNRIVRTTFVGVVTSDEVAEHATLLRNDPAFKSDFSELVNLSAALEIQLGYSEFQHLEFVDPFLHEARRAFVVPRRSQAYGTTRMFQTMRKNHETIQIFDNVESALAWLQGVKAEKN